MPFTDRSDAGKRLANALATFEGTDPIVVAVTGGGVAVAAEIARALRLPMEVLVVERLVDPDHPHRVLGAVGPNGVRLVDREQTQRLRIPPDRIHDLVAEASTLVAQRTQRFQGDRPPLDVRGRDVILVDEGVRTGTVARLATRLLRIQGPRRLVLAVPTAPAPVLATLREEVDGLVSLTATERSRPIASLYRLLPEVAEAAERALLEELHKPSRRAERPPDQVSDGLTPATGTRLAAGERGAA